MRAIHKYTLNNPGVNTFQVNGESIDSLTVQVQNGEIVLWGIVSGIDSATFIEKSVVVVPTGGLIPADINKTNYIATVQLNGFVWHVFDKED